MTIHAAQSDLFITKKSCAADTGIQNRTLLMGYKYPALPCATPSLSSSSSSAITQITTTFYTIYSTIFERFRASTDQTKCPPPPSRPRLPTPPWEPTATLTASSCKVTCPGSVFALQTGNSKNTSERRHTYF